MRKQMKKVLAITAAMAMTGAMFVGCGNSASETTTALDTTIQNEEMPLAGPSQAEAPYFVKGVYANYSAELDNPTKDYFYIFEDVSFGYTEQGPEGIGVPFSCTQEDGKVSFLFGSDSEDPEVFNVTEVKGDFVYGYFEGVEDRPLVFELLVNQDPATFKAENYLSGGDYVYEDPNGWKVHYNPDVITVNKGSNIVNFVYTGDCAGACLVTATYDVDMNGKDKADALAKSFGANSTINEITFPGTEDVKGYVVYCEPNEGEVPLYSTALVRDYMDGYLVFEETVTNSGNEDIDMAVSDNLAGIIDSLEFVQY